MLESLPEQISQELRAANTRRTKRASRLRVEADGISYRVLRLTGEGFVLEAADAPQLRGLVDLFDRGRHVSQCLIVAAAQDGDEMIYDFKRNTVASDGAPLDFERAVESIVDDRVEKEIEHAFDRSQFIDGDDVDERIGDAIGDSSFDAAVRDAVREMITDGDIVLSIDVS